MVRKRRIALLAGLVIVVLLVVFIGIPKYRAFFAPNVALPGSEKEQVVYIRTGSSFDDVKQSLATFLKDTSTFIWAAERMGYTAAVKPGRYIIKKKMTNRQLIGMLRLGAQVPLNISFHNIRFKEQVASMIGRKLEADSSAVLSLLSDSAYLSSFGATPDNVMGLFVSNTYQFNWNTSAEELIERMTEEWEKVWTEERMAKAAEWKLSPMEVMTLAAIVQEETARKDEAPKIAGVYLNRLQTDMMLQADPTLKYIRLSKNRNSTIRRIYNKDKKDDSYYNTYKHTGLPPGPIVLPEVWAIDAVLDAEKHDYIFFVAKDDFSGYHVFTKTYKEHEAYSRRYRQELNRRNIR